MTPTDGAPKAPILSLPKKPPQRTIRYVEDGTIPLPDVVAYLDKGTNLLIVNRDNFAKLTEAQRATVLARKASQRSNTGV
jgi:hypothetical protein